MILSVCPAKKIQGTIKLPPSKSYSIRSMIVASCGGRSRIQNLSSCDDARVALSVVCHFNMQTVSLKDNSFLIYPSLKKQSKNIRFNVGESGTVLRFVLPLIAFNHMRGAVDAKGTLCRRPNHHLVLSLRQLGANISGRGKEHTAPIMFRGGECKGKVIKIDGSLSSQFISAFLIAAPFLGRDIEIVISGKEIVSRPYIQMTLEIMARAGIRVKRKSSRVFFIEGQQQYQGLKNFTVPSDYGLAAFWLGAAALTKSSLKLKGFFDNSLPQADGAVISLLKRMGVCLTQTKTQLLIQGPFDLKGGSFCLRDCPDLLPLMVVLALFAKRKTRLSGVAHARVKESDRIGDLKNELLKIGAKIKDGPGDITIYPQKHYKSNIILNPHQDHRLAMAFSILGLKIGIKVKDIDCISKSYPNFLIDLKKIAPLAIIGKNSLKIA
jgi:3-phosphoshikimate 1-carboxyvinyltransferase